MDDLYSLVGNCIIERTFAAIDGAGLSKQECLCPRCKANRRFIIVRAHASIKSDLGYSSRLL